MGLKGIVHFKMNMLSSFLTLKLFNSNLLVLNTKEDILKNMGNQTSIKYFFFFLWMEVNGIHQLSCLPTLFKISSFVFSRKKKFIEV